jgi:uncharacterized membrane protein YesL
VGYSLVGGGEVGLYPAAAAAVGYSLVGDGDVGLYPAAAAAVGYSRVGEGGGDEAHSGGLHEEFHMSLF